LDTKLLLLTIPGCVVLWAKRNRVGRLALLTTFAALFLTGDIPWVILLSLMGKLHVPANRFTDYLLVLIQTIPVPVMLLLTGMFYLWVYVCRSAPKKECKKPLSEVTA